MSTKIEKMEEYAAQLEEMGETVDGKLLEAVTDGLGPANYNDDASLVACSDKDELKRVYTNFVADELGVSDEEKGMEAVEAVCEKMTGIRRKHRAVFYYLLTKMIK